MNASEILSSLQLVKNTYNSAHCAKLAEIFKFFTSIKKEITDVRCEPSIVMFGKVVKREKQHGVMQETVTNEGTKMPCTKFTVVTPKGEYSVCVPTGNAFYESVCDLLKIPIVRETVTVQETISLPAEAIVALQKASKFVSKDDLRPAMQHILIEFEKGVCRVAATNAHFLYCSKDFATGGYRKKLSLLIPAGKINKIPVNGSFELALINKDTVAINGCKFSLCHEKFPDYKVVVPDYTAGIAFNRKKMMELIKEVLPHANKATHQVDFSFNGAIYLHTQDVDFSTEATRKMLYAKKDLPDFATAFNGNFLTAVLAALDSSEVTMLHCGLPTKAAIFTNGSARILLMPLQPNDGQNYVPPTEPMKELPAPAVPVQEVEPAPAVAQESTPAKVDKVKRTKNVEKIDGKKVDEPVELSEMGSIIVVAVRWASQARKINRILTCTYQYSNRQYKIDGLPKENVAQMLTQHGIKIK